MTHTTDETKFGNELVALGEHVITYPSLPRIFRIDRNLQDVLSLRLDTYERENRGPEGLAAWAATLSNVTSFALRITEKQVDGHVVGLLAGHQVDITGSLPPESFPREGREHQWDVTVQLQEA